MATIIDFLCKMLNRHTCSIKNCEIVASEEGAGVQELAPKLSFVEIKLLSKPKSIKYMLYLKLL